jgi:hypothetical protein
LISSSQTESNSLKSQLTDDIFRRRRFGLRFNLIAGIYNYELALGYHQVAEKTFAEELLT